MPKSVPFLDCCGKPALDVVKCWVSTECVTVSLRLCRNCNAHWFYHLKKYRISSEEYDRRAWYVLLTPERRSLLPNRPNRLPPVCLPIGKASRGARRGSRRYGGCRHSLNSHWGIAETPRRVVRLRVNCVLKPGATDEPK
jgi:hypothetical protein